MSLSLAGNLSYSIGYASYFYGGIADVLSIHRGSGSVSSDVFDDIVSFGNRVDPIIASIGVGWVRGQDLDLEIKNIFSIKGSPLNDTYYGFSGNNVLYNDDSFERLISDRFDGGAGDDQFFGYGGNDFYYGNEGNDFGLGGAGDDTMDGGTGDDLLYGGSGNDIMYGGRTGEDELHGNAGDDFIQGSTFGSSTLYGGPGDDYLVGGAGNDVMIGGQGNDILRGNGGIDTFIGSSGADQFHFQLNDMPSTSKAGDLTGAERIIDFNVGDSIHLLTIASYEILRIEDDYAVAYEIGDEYFHVLTDEDPSGSVFTDIDLVI